jgi:hypothetical protein
MPLSKDEKKDLIQIILSETKKKRNKKREIQKKKTSRELKSPRSGPQTRGPVASPEKKQRYINELQRNIAKQYEKN